jgi:hypothetical protein
MIFENPTSNYQRTVNSLLSKSDFDDNQLEFKDIMGSLFFGLIPSAISGAVQGADAQRMQENAKIETLGNNVVEMINEEYKTQQPLLNEINLYKDNPDGYVANKAIERFKFNNPNFANYAGAEGDLNKGYSIYVKNNPNQYEAEIAKIERQIRADMDNKSLSPFATTKRLELTSAVKDKIVKEYNNNPANIFTIIKDAFGQDAADSVKTEISIQNTFPTADKFFNQVKAFEENEVNQLQYLSSKDAKAVNSFLNSSKLTLDTKFANQQYGNIEDRFLKNKGNATRTNAFVFSTKDNNGVVIDETTGQVTGTFTQKLQRSKLDDVGIIKRDVNGNFFVEESNEALTTSAIANDLTKLAAYIKGTNNSAVSQNDNVPQLIDDDSVNLALEFLQNRGAFYEIGGERGYKPLFSGYTDNSQELFDRIKSIATTGSTSEQAFAMIEAKVAKSILDSSPSVESIVARGKINRYNFLVSELKGNRNMPEEKIEDMLLETETIKEEVQALRDIASGSEVSAEDAEIADKAIIKELISPTSKQAEYATFRNYKGDKEIIDILSHASSYESKLKLYNLYADKYGQDKDLFNTVEGFKPQDIIPETVTPTQELFGPPRDLMNQLSEEEEEGLTTEDLFGTFGASLARRLQGTPTDTRFDRRNR